MYVDFCILLKKLGLVRMFVGSILINPDETIIRLLGTPRSLKDCVTYLVPPWFPMKTDYDSLVQVFIFILLKD